MDPNRSGGPRNGPPGNMQMRPPPSPGNNTMNLGRPPHPVQRPPPQHPAQDQQQNQQQRQQQLQPPMQPGGTTGGRSPVLSPFQKQGPGSEGQPQIAPGQGFRPTQPSPPTGQHGQPSPIRPGTAPPGAIHPQRPPQQPQQQQHQMQPRPHASTFGQQPGQFSHPGRPLAGPMHTGGQGQPRPAGAGSPQSQSSPAIRPVPHPGQQQHQQQQVHQPLTNGMNMRPSSSHSNLAGGAPGGPGGPGGPGMQPGNRFTPPSPSLGNTRSPQIRPLQQSPQSHEGVRPIVPQQQHQQQQQQQQQPGLRSSLSQPHLAHQPGVRPPPAQHSPVQAHQVLNIRPSGPMMQQQPRPRPPSSQAAPPGQTPDATGHSVQLDMPAVNGGQINGGQSPYSTHQSVSQQQHQRPPGARPILDPHRQQTSPMQPAPAQAQRHSQASSTQNPTQRPLQRPPSAQTQPPRHQPAPNTADGSPQHDQREVGPSGSPANSESPKSMNGDNRQAQRPSPQQQHSGPPVRRPTNPQLVTGDGSHQHYSSPGSATRLNAPRPINVPGSSGQRPLGATEIKSPGPALNMPSRPPMQKPPQSPMHQPSQQQRQMQQPPLQKLPQSETSPFTEPEAPPSDTASDIVDDDDIENTGVKSAPSNAPTSTQPAADRPPPQAVTTGGPPLGPPRGPPRNEGNIPRKVSTSTGSGPARIIPPSNNPSSPPASAFPPVNPLRPRVRPPPGNKVHSPYRPPERPSQAPVMYSQSGQPTLVQPFTQQDDKPLAEQSPIAASMIPQGAEAASSSIRPRESGLQKRVVANDTSSSKADGSTTTSNSPPSPKLHGQKGPAILSVAGQRRAPSAVRTMKTWVIRGGIAYLGYTAVFNCAPDTAGVKGLYCKTTNGLGGLVKPLVAPHYNAHLGPHVDQYVKPVARQSHRIYMKVADPVVQGAMSAAGTVYKATAKKHVDSVKDQVISILPYPLKAKTVVSKDSDHVRGGDKSVEHENHPELGKISRQPIHVENPKDIVDEVEPDATDDEHASEAVKEEEDTDKSDEQMDALQDENPDATNEDVEHDEPNFESTEPDVHGSTEEHMEPEDNEESVETEASETMEDSGKEQKHVEVEETDASDIATNEETGVEETIVDDSITDEPAVFEDPLKNFPEDTKESTNDEQETAEKGDGVRTEEPIHADLTHKVQDSESTLTATEESQETIASDPVPAVAESTPEFVDIPTEVATPEEEEQAQLEMTADAAEPEITPVVAEEEPREQIPVATDAHTSFEQEDGASQGHGTQQDVKDLDGDKKGSEDVQEQAVKGTEQALPEEHKESDATPEQQAAPVPETEHRQETTSTHDEL